MLKTCQTCGRKYAAWRDGCEACVRVDVEAAAPPTAAYRGSAAQAELEVVPEPRAAAWEVEMLTARLERQARVAAHEATHHRAPPTRALAFGLLAIPTLITLVTLAELSRDPVCSELGCLGLALLLVAQIFIGTPVSIGAVFAAPRGRRWSMALVAAGIMLVSIVPTIVKIR